jgi:hypothetical protein
MGIVQLHKESYIYTKSKTYHIRVSCTTKLNGKWSVSIIQVAWCTDSSFALGRIEIYETDQHPSLFFNKFNGHPWPVSMQVACCKDSNFALGRIEAYEKNHELDSADDAAADDGDGFHA